MLNSGKKNSHFPRQKKINILTLVLSILQVKWSVPYDRFRLVETGIKQYKS